MAKSEKKDSINVNVDDKKKKKKWLIIIICIVVIAVVANFGYLSYQSKRKDEAQKVAFDNVAVEVKDDYTETIPLTNEENILKTEELVEVLKDDKKDKNTKIVKVNKDSIDTSKEGRYTIIYTIETVDSLGNKATKEYEKTFTVTSKDEVAPVITFNKDTVEINEGEKYNPSENIKSVTDDFDGDIPNVNKKPFKTGTAYYLIDDSNLDTSKAGEYKVKVTAVDKSGNEASKEFVVKVNAKKEENSTENNQTPSSSTNNSGTSSNKPQQTCSQVKTKDAWDEQVLTSAAWNEKVVDQPAWDETVNIYVGNIVVCRCGQRFNSYNEWQNHMNSEPDLDSHGAYHVEGQYSTSIIHHDATYKTVHHDAVYATVHHDAEYTTVCK